MLLLLNQQEEKKRQMWGEAKPFGKEQVPRRSTTGAAGQKKKGSKSLSLLDETIRSQSEMLVHVFLIYFYQLYILIYIYRRNCYKKTFSVFLLFFLGGFFVFIGDDAVSCFSRGQMIPRFGSRRRQKGPKPTLDPTLNSVPYRRREKQKKRKDKNVHREIVF